MDFAAYIIGYNKNIQGILLNDYNFTSNLNSQQLSDSVVLDANSLSNFLKTGTSFRQKLQIFNSFSKIDNSKECLVSPGDFLVEVNIQDWPFCNRNNEKQNTDGCINIFGNYNEGEYLDYEFLIKGA